MAGLSSYKLVQFLKEYVNPEGIEIPVVMCLRTVQTWLCTLRFVYKEVRKDVFVDGHKRTDVVEDQNCFLTHIEELKPYMVEVDEDGGMKAKEYLVDCAVGVDERQPVIIITHDECIFSANDGVQKA